MLYQFTYKGNKTILIHQYANKKIRENSSLTNFKQKNHSQYYLHHFLCNHGIGFQIYMKKFNLIKIVIKSVAVIYSGDFENTNSDIKLLNYNHLGDIL